MSRNTKLKKLVIHILMVLYIIVILFPLTWMLISGFKSNSEIFGSPWTLPTSLSPKNFIYVWNTYIAKATLNSLMFTVFGTGLVVFISSMAAYAVIRFRIKYRYALFMFILSGMMLAPQCSLIPIYKMLSLTKLYNTRVGLLLTLLFVYRFLFFLCGHL